MSKKQAPGSETLFLTRRNVLAMSAAAAASLYLPVGLIRSARAQTSQSGVQYNQNVIGRLPDFYVSPTGTGSASTGGTAANPWPISMLSDPTAQGRYAGFVVGLMDGTYGLYDIMGLPPAGLFSGDNRLKVKPGTAAQPTIIVSQSLHGAIIDGQRDAIYAADPSLDWGEGLMGPYTYAYGFTGAGVTFDGIKFTGANFRCITNYGGYGRGGNGNNGCDNFTVRNCWFTDQSYITAGSTGKNSAMFYSEGQDHIYVQNCRFEGGGAPSDGGRFNSVQFYAPTNDTVVEYCTVISPANGGGYGSSLYWKCGAAYGHVNPVSRYNYLDRSGVTDGRDGSSVIQFDGSNQTSSVFEIANTIAIASGGFPCIVGSPTGQPQGFVGTWNVHDCTFVGDWSGQGMFYGQWDTKTPAAVDFQRCIVWPTAGGGQNGDMDVATLGVVGTISYNLYPTSAAKFCVGNATSTYASLASWQAAASGLDAHSEQHDPGFAGTGTESAQYMVAGGYAATFASDGGEIGAWRGASQVGCSFGGGIVLARPDAPQIVNVS